jgi:hypothetical protein
MSTLKTLETSRGLFSYETSKFLTVSMFTSAHARGPAYVSIRQLRKRDQKPFAWETSKFLDRFLDMQSNVSCPRWWAPEWRTETHYVSDKQSEEGTSPSGSARVCKLIFLLLSACLTCMLSSGAVHSNNLLEYRRVSVSNWTFELYDSRTTKPRLLSCVKPCILPALCAYVSTHEIVF